MLGEAIKFPYAGDEGVKSILIGGVLLFFSFLIIPIIIVQGYLVRVLKAGVEGVDEAPAFDEWGDLLVDGVKLLVINIAYALIPTVLFFIAIFMFVGIGSVSQGGDPNPAALTGLGLVGILFIIVAFTLLLLATYLLPAAGANFARKDDLGAAFEFGTIFDGAFSADYFVAALLAFLIAIAVSVLAFFLIAITFGLFALVMVFVQFYLQVAIYYLLARGFAEGLGLDSAGVSPSTATVE